MDINCRNEFYKQLDNGLIIPEIAYGTGITHGYRIYNTQSKLRKIRYWASLLLRDQKQLKNDIGIVRVLDALESMGVFLIDTSRAYNGSEFCVGKMLKRHGRKKFFVITKLSNYYQYRQGGVRECMEKCLHELDTDYVDMFLMHWPVDEVYLENWKDMEQLYIEGKCRSIGVCNCNIHHLEALKKVAKISPMVNEIEVHPLFTQVPLREYCEQNGIQVLAYTATGRMDGRFANTCIPDIAEKYNKTIAQIILRWHLQIGTIPIVNTYNVDHMRKNADIHDFSLDEAEIRKISNCNINSRLRYDPDNCDFRRL